MKKILFLLILFLGKSASPFEDSSFHELPALTATKNDRDQWVSHNQWMCFSPHQLSLDCVKYDNSVLVPSIRAEDNLYIHSFDVHVEDHLDCQTTLFNWKKLLAENQEICVYGAQMPDDMGADALSGKILTLWYLEKIKAGDNEWELNEESDYMIKE